MKQKYEIIDEGDSSQSFETTLDEDEARWYSRHGYIVRLVE